jgi:hypothetical protein
MEIRHAEDSMAYLDGLKVLVVGRDPGSLVVAVPASDGAAHVHLTRRNPVAVEDTGDMTIYTFALSRSAARTRADAAFTPA